jgi:hypothetical protein
MSEEIRSAAAMAGVTHEPTLEHEFLASAAACSTFVELAIAWETMVAPVSRAISPECRAILQNAYDIAYSRVNGR